ncbi:MAG: nucleoside transporter [Candidatus Lambdaproteobacteria bacterium RIFOXYD1_FULL_56_27]|uniref:Nucleoside transporter n=1 Tax=Candidatus Lambdaproteobacteria bacterium RIFOXYD2_FULL_56_26 TaxID=1817773 RepID=A0A1F6H3N9_9PROT|nr:MAG: nucleoside transporter [Candidatus Lambdaproteobacteria bacterium RIFOXYC1_FULL_56_13]OGH04934.1 MAG: nucleoside transporter [Candidatus Lambdaproteobacteria bacterium RIFOXYD2_FULL_56_26]OGH09399.1 MAG: nucleoside transporter [Candidatus Lambdaproteobacteria bacterium RIFOXYD1_FULL_56_27]
MESYNLVSFLGLFALIGLAYLLSAHRSKVSWKMVAWALGLQLLFGLFVFLLPQGRQLFWLLNSLVVQVLGVSGEGIRFLFGPLALGPGQEGSLGFILAFQTLPSIIFFSALVAILYYLKVMPWVIRVFAKLFTKTLGISGAEGVSVASNIFVGVESTLTIKPHLAKMTASELCTILTAGMATVASNILALYVFTLQGVFPAIAGHLISASFISAPAAVLMAKLLLPETGQPETLGLAIHPHYDRDSGFFEAVINGAQSGVQLILGIGALLVAVLGLVALANLGLGALGSLAGLDLTLQTLLGYLFYPFSLLVGIPLEDAVAISRILGERLVVTEVVSYQDLAQLAQSGQMLHPRSLVIASYVLCGFAHFASLAIFVGGAAALAPERTKAIAQVGLRALLAATLACLMTGAIAGTFYNHTSLLLAG